MWDGDLYRRHYATVIALQCNDPTVAYKGIKMAYGVCGVFEATLLGVLKEYLLLVGAFL